MSISCVYFLFVFKSQMESLIKNNQFGMYKINQNYFLSRFHYLSVITEKRVTL
jgi:hypothetical protein